MSMKAAYTRRVSFSCIDSKTELTLVATGRNLNDAGKKVEVEMEGERGEVSMLRMTESLCDLK